MKRSIIISFILGFVLVLFASCTENTQKNTNVETTGEIGSPGATTTISGEQLPAPNAKFGGVIKDDALNSTHWWAPRIVPPSEAPNILLIITDDAGFGVPSTTGGVIPTPTMDRVAANGLLYNNIHSTALCSPTRAALITGRNHHSAGFGVISEQSTGFPGYNSIMQKTKQPLAESCLIMDTQLHGLEKITTHLLLKRVRSDLLISGQQD